MVRQNAVALGALIANPTLAGVDQTKDWYIGVYTNGQEEPSVVFGIPVTDAAAAQGALGGGMKSKAYGSWLYYSDDEEAIPESAKEDASIEAVMKGEPTTVFDKGDIALFVNLAHLMEAYSDELTAGVEQAKQGLEQIPAQPGVDAEAMKKIYGDMLNYVVQGLKDSRQVTIAINVGAEGISCEDYLSFAPRSQTASLLGGQNTSAMALASKLPPDAVMVFGTSGDMRRLMEWGMTFAKSVGPAGGDSQKAIDEFLSSIKDVKFGAMMGSFALTKGDQGLFRYSIVTEVAPIAKYKEIARKMSTTMGKVEAPGLKQEISLKTDAESYGSLKADLLTIKQEFDENADPTGQVKQMQAMMFGPNGMESRVVYMDDKFVQTMGGGKEAMTEALKSLNSSDSSSAVTQFRKGLIDSPNLLVMVDVPGLVVQGLRVASSIRDCR